LLLKQRYWLTDSCICVMFGMRSPRRDRRQSILSAQPIGSHDALELIGDRPPMTAPEILDRPLWVDFCPTQTGRWWHSSAVNVGPSAGRRRHSKPHALRRSGVRSSHKTARQMGSTRVPLSLDHLASSTAASAFGTRTSDLAMRVPRGHFIITSDRRKPDNHESGPQNARSSPAPPRPNTTNHTGSRGINCSPK